LTGVNLGAKRIVARRRRRACIAPQNVLDLNVLFLEVLVFVERLETLFLRTEVREILLYIFFGLLTTAVNMLTFAALEGVFGKRVGKRSYWFSNPAAWCAAVAFAFVTNKIWVFRSASWQPNILWRELLPFVLARVFSLALEQGLMVVFFDRVWKRVGVSFAKVWQSRFRRKSDPEKVYRFAVKLFVIQVFVVALNYIFSKYYIFSL
jgi:putative flippase GtrA